MSTTTVPCRLLCASRMAYMISDNDQPVPGCPPYDGAAGFKEAPVGFVAGPLGINAAMVGTSADGVVLTFRGTLPPDSPNHEQTILDWLNDADAVLISVPGIQGKVHQGFWNALDSLWPALEAEVRQQMEASPKASLVITGHSKGGAMADLAAARFAQAGVGSTVYTYAAAHPGNQEFAGYYATLAGIQSSYRYEYADDIVPHLPPSLVLRQALKDVPGFEKFHAELATRDQVDIDYAPVGTLRFINWEGVVVKDTPLLPLERAYHLVDLILHRQFEQIVRDHSIDCGGGYATAICPTGVCG
ncbi:lipase family protein [Azospira inquinata]|uniref:Lipase family protein n=1 Tax=Azospira inquinata TaxID=2785627 RepID=A0A975XVZ5_9RHOO|nr:lipase family protein [Azospira inquinata]QWT47025.1 lipase family protein [Azospira inquinata]QWT50344.1 lipase family protein [Azospira inquinata]